MQLSSFFSFSLAWNTLYNIKNIHKKTFFYRNEENNLYEKNWELNALVSFFFFYSVTLSSANFDLLRCIFLLGKIITDVQVLAKDLRARSARRGEFSAVATGRIE